MSTVTIELAADTEQKLREQASRSGKSLETYVQELAERATQDQAAAGPSATPSAPTEETPEQKVAMWRAWVAKQPRRNVIADDSRESIYEGRGE
jgi:hypothetical protein